MTKNRFSGQIVLALAFGWALVGGSDPQAKAQGAPVTLTDIAVESGPITYRIPRIEIRGGNLSEAEARLAFAKDSAMPLAEQIGRFSAQEVTIPELVIEQPVGSARNKTTYRDIVLSSVAQGRIASVSGSGGVFESSDPHLAGMGRFGRLAASELDLARMLAVFSGKAGSGQNDLQRLYGSFSLDNLIASGPKGEDFRIGRIAARDFQARATADSWSETMQKLGELGASNKPSDANNAHILGLSADLLDSFDFGAFEVADMEVRGTKNSKDPQVKIARLAYTGSQSGRSSEARVEGIDVAGPQGGARVASIVFSDFSFNATIAAFKEARDKPLVAPDPRALRKMLPTLGTIRMSGLEFSMPRTGGPVSAEAKTDLMRLRAFELAAEKPINGIPTSIRVALDNLTFPIEGDAKEDGMRELASMGYRSADLSTQLAVVWSEAPGELALRDLSLRGADMGSIALRGTFGNVGRDLFDPDTAVASVALVAATLKSVDIAIENGGLADKLLTQQAAEQRRSPEELRREYGMTAAVGVPALLGNSPQAKAFGSAVARFIAKPNRLTITARARDGVGLGAGDLALLGDPNAIMSKIDLTAKAE